MASEYSVPEDWQIHPLEEVMEAIIDYRGKSPSKTTAGIPLITAKIVKGGRILTPDEFIAPGDYDDWMRRGFPKAGDILITTEAPLGEVAQLDGSKVALAQRLIALRGKSGTLNNTFLKFLLQSKGVQDELHSRSTGTTVSGIRQSELRLLQIPVPPIEEQNEIANVLGALDDKIELNRKMNKTLEAMARALFQSWFVDFDPVRAKAEGRPTSLPDNIAALFPDSFEDSELGEIPKGWQVRKLGDVCEAIFSGGTPSTTNANYWGGDIPWFSSGETREKFIIATEKTITREGVENSSTRFAKIGATVIASAGQGNTRGQASMLLIDTYINQSVVALSANKKLLTDAFLFCDLERRYEEFRRVSDGHSSRGSLTTKLLSGLDCVLPPFPVVQAFDTFASQIVARVGSARRQSQALSEARDSLLPKLISGEMRLPQRSSDAFPGGVV